MIRYVIVGNGAAAVTAAQSIVRANLSYALSPIQGFSGLLATK